MKLKKKKEIAMLQFYLLGDTIDIGVGWSGIYKSWNLPNVVDFIWMTTE